MRTLITGLLVVVLLASCGRTTLPTTEPSSNAAAGVTATITPPTPTDVPLKATIASTIDVPTPSDTPTASASIPAGWTTVAWEGLTIPIPAESQWQAGELGVAHGMGDPSLNRGLDATVLAQGQIVASTGEAGMTFIIVYSEGTVDGWFGVEGKSGGGPNLIDLTSVRDLRIADHAATSYRLNSNYYQTVVSYHLKTNYNQALIMRVFDSENPVYQTVLDSMHINVPQTMPTATPTPLPCGEMPIQPSSPSNTVPNINDWPTAEWQNLSIPIPPEHFWQVITDSNDVNLPDPVVAQASIIFDRAAHPEITIEAPSGFGFTILEFAGSPQAWVIQHCESNALSVDLQSVRETTVADKPALVYNPMVTGTGLIQQYIVDLGEGRLMWISTDIAYLGYEDVIAGIQLNE